jgi:hypothetical protein
VRDQEEQEQRETEGTREINKKKTERKQAEKSKNRGEVNEKQK